MCRDQFSSMMLNFSLLLVVLCLTFAEGVRAAGIPYHPAHHPHTHVTNHRGHGILHGEKPSMSVPDHLHNHQIKHGHVAHDHAGTDHVRHHAPAHPQMHEIRRKLKQSEEDGEEEYWDDGCDSIVEEAIHGRLGGLRKAIECGSDVDESSASGDTGLHIAAMSGNIPMMKELLRAGATIDKRNNQGATAFHRAAAGGRERAARFLLYHGADIEAIDNHGLSALKHAEMSHHHKTARHLRRAFRRLMDEKKANETHLAEDEKNTEL